MTKATNKAAKATNVETIVPATAPVANVVETIVPAATAPAAVAVVTKADKARAVFAKAYPDGKTTTMQRKDIIGAMIAEAGLTKAGAATYLQNMKNKAGITVHRTPVTA